MRSKVEELVQSRCSQQEMAGCLLYLVADMIHRARRSPSNLRSSVFGCKFMKTLIRTEPMRKKAWDRMQQPVHEIWASGWWSNYELVGAVPNRNNFHSRVEPSHGGRRCHVVPHVAGCLSRSIQHFSLHNTDMHWSNKELMTPFWAGVTIGRLSWNLGFGIVRFWAISSLVASNHIWDSPSIIIWDKGHNYMKGSVSWKWLTMPWYGSPSLFSIMSVVVINLDNGWRMRDWARDVSS